MFELFSGSHILILLAVALTVVGPKDLPRLMHMIGQWTARARRLADEFRRSFDDMARQEELAKLHTELGECRNISIETPSPALVKIDAAPGGTERHGGQAP
jgi:sec-independent protein translocase protein TatB